MPTVDHVNGRIMVRDVQYGGGDECLATILGLAFGGRGVVQVRGDGSLQEGDQLGQVGLFVGRGPECAEKEGGIPDRLEALAPDIADDDPGSFGRAGGGIQVAADLRLGLRGQVDGGDAQRADPVGNRFEHHFLCGHRHRAQLAQFPFMASSQVSKDGHER